MKICIALHQCMDLGGIINHTEQLMRGLADLGHEVHLREMVWKENVRGQSKSNCPELSQQGIPYSQSSGWNFPMDMRIPYAGRALKSACDKLKQFDLVIWTIPVPPKNKENIGNSDWIELHDLPSSVKQIAFSHDGNAFKNYPHLLGIADKLSGLACVHHCALNTCSFLPIPRALVLNPQFLPVKEVAPHGGRWKGFISAQTFKAWKHAHELVGAIRFMPKRESLERRLVIGKGIEYQYLTSVDKCKDAYFHEDGERFWEAALDNGMTHLDYQTYDELEKFMGTTMTLVDPSWSQRYSQVGGHYNRVVVEAMINGAVSIARKMGMGTELFTAGVNYVEIPRDADLYEYAEVVRDAGFMSEKSWLNYRRENVQLLQQFDRKTIAKRVIDLANGEIETQTGSPSQSIWRKAEDILESHYGIIV